MVFTVRAASGGPDPRWGALKVRLDACCLSAAVGARRRSVAAGGLKLPPLRGAQSSACGEGGARSGANGVGGGSGAGAGGGHPRATPVWLVTLSAPASADRRGLLRDAVAALGACDLTVVRVAAGEAGDGGGRAIADRFWVVDGAAGGGGTARAWRPGRDGADGDRDGDGDGAAAAALPLPHRVSAVVTALRAAVGGGEDGGGDVAVSVADAAALVEEDGPPPATAAAPPFSSSSSPPTRASLDATRRRACIDAPAAAPLRAVARKKEAAAVATGAAPAAPAPAAPAEAEAEQEDEFAWPCPVTVTLDNRAAPAHSLLTIACPDRKGLVYDLFRTVMDVGLDVAYARIGVGGGGRA